MRGGKRKGAGRPRGSHNKSKPAGESRAMASVPAAGAESPASTVEYTDAQAYLEAVALGREPADALRIQAAKAVIPYQSRRKRAPLSPVRTPKAQQHSDDLAAGGDLNECFKRRVVEIAEARKRKETAK